MESKKEEIYKRLTCPVLNSLLRSLIQCVGSDCVAWKWTDVRGDDKTKWYGGCRLL